MLIFLVVQFNLPLSAEERLEKNLSKRFNKDIICL